MPPDRRGRHVRWAAGSLPWGWSEQADPQARALRQQRLCSPHLRVAGLCYFATKGITHASQPS